MVCVGMTVQISIKKKKHTWVWGSLVCVVGVRAESWHADVDLHKERKEKKIQKKILTWVWMMDMCVRASVLRADAD